MTAVWQTVTRELGQIRQRGGCWKPQFRVWSWKQGPRRSFSRTALYSEETEAQRGEAELSGTHSESGAELVLGWVMLPAPSPSHSTPHAPLVSWDALSLLVVEVLLTLDGPGPWEGELEHAPIPHAWPWAPTSTEHLLGAQSVVLQTDIPPPHHSETTLFLKCVCVG